MFGLIVIMLAAISRQWSNVGSWAHVGILTGAAVFFLLAGLSVRHVREPAIQRLTGVTWLLSVMCAAGAAGYVTYDLIFSFTAADQNAGAVTALGVGLAVSAYAAVLWLIRRQALQVAAVFGGLVTLICGVIATAAGGRAVNGAFLACARCGASASCGQCWAGGGMSSRCGSLCRWAPCWPWSRLPWGPGRTGGCTRSRSSPPARSWPSVSGCVAPFSWDSARSLMRATQPAQPPALGAEEPGQLPNTAETTEPRAEEPPRRDLPTAS